MAWTMSPTVTGVLACREQCHFRQLGDADPDGLERATGIVEPQPESARVVGNRVVDGRHEQVEISECSI